MDLNNLKPDTRRLSEMKEVVFDKKWAENAPDLELYLMYRDLSENKTDQEKIIEQKLRYDITIMPALLLGQEYNKTAGHDHPLVPDTKITYPELYEVLKGEAIFLIQDSQEDKIKDIYAVKAKKGDKIIVPPNYEHLMINPSNQELKTANWVCRDFNLNIYQPFKNKQGFGYYGLKENGGVKWIKNENYQDIPELKFIEPNQLLEKLKINQAEPIYNLINQPEKLNFLKNPQEYEWE